MAKIKHKAKVRVRESKIKVIFKRCAPMAVEWEGVMPRESNE